MYEQVAAAGPLEPWDSEIAKPDARSRLCTFRHLYRLQTIERQQIDLGSERRLGDVDGNCAIQVVALALEDRMFLHLNDDVKVAGWAAVRAGLPFIRQTQA